MRTIFLLMARYDAKPIVPVEDVCRDFFTHLTPEKLVRKIESGELALPLVRIESSQKSAKGIHLDDLARYLDQRREVAVKECRQLQG